MSEERIAFYRAQFREEETQMSGHPDIVGRLDATAAHCRDVGYTPLADEFANAAREIERLRTALHDIRVLTAHTDIEWALRVMRFTIDAALDVQK